ncbi:hypothetical protein Riv7116_4961 [Rivularia sp. PCC 7116]|uniref:hypothetical protein n=1 Tax=Rivularia sp. PCC 7116 TaxID=373994 RepID=UPI00029F4DC6|nr:hypothetical protein [Rivularia sp. PCC 7116]AFY57368.1 hypothetical protein Riv7116_4961 [Rivularia sp. PCC 7116]
MTGLILATERYIEQNYIDSNPTLHMEQSTLEYLYAAFSLYEYKQTRTRKQYRALLEEYRWDKGSTEERRSLKIAENFQAFVGCPEHLAVLPVPILLRLCSKNYNVLIEKLQDIPIGGLTCKLVLELIKERAKFLKSQRKEKKVGNWRATPDGNRYYTFGKIVEDDHQTGVLTEKLIEQFGFSPQRIVRMAIADFYDNQIVEIPTDKISSLTDLITDEKESNTINSEDVESPINWESKQQEFESLLQKDTGGTESEYTNESEIDSDKDVNEVPNNTQIDIDSQATVQQEVPQEAETTPTPLELASKLQFLRSLPMPFSKKDRKFACEIVSSIASTCDTWESIATVTQRDSMSLAFVVGFLEDEQKAWFENLPKLLADYAVTNPEELMWVDGVTRTRALAAMGFEVGSKVEVITNHHNCKGRRGHIVDLSMTNKIPIGVRFPGMRKYFYYTDLKLVCNQNEDDAASEDISKKVEMLLQATCWEEVVSTTDNWTEELKSATWKVLGEEAQQHISNLKNQYFEKLEKIPQVGDKVIWNNCPGNLTSWQPFMITDIQGAEAKLDFYMYMVPLAELSKVEN